MREGLNQTIAEIQRLGPGAEATSLAMEIFGARAGPDMAAAILEGRFEFEELVKQIAASPETVKAAGAATETFAEKMAILRNQVTLAVEPIGKQLVDALTELLPQFTALIGEITGAVTWFSNLSPSVQRSSLIFIGFAAAIGPVLVVLGNLVSVAATVTTTIVGMKKGLTALKVTYGGLLPAIAATTKALWLKFAALAAAKPWLLVGAVAATALAARFIAQAVATRRSAGALQGHTDVLRGQTGVTQRVATQTDQLRTSLQQVGTQARQTGRDISDAATSVQDRIRAAVSRVDRLHDALFRALRRKYEKDRDAAMRTIDQQFEARRAAINKQLDLLDETGRREDFHADRAEKVTEIAMLRREAGYEVDARRRAAIMNRVTEIEKDLSEGQLRFDRDTKRRGLQEQLSTLRTEEDTARASAMTLWEGRLSEAVLGAKAEQLIILNNQTEILNLLRTHGDGWRDIGATFGQRLIEGMGPYATELSRMVQTALADARAAADGTIAKLRKAAAAVAAPTPAARVTPGVAPPGLRQEVAAPRQQGGPTAAVLRPRTLQDVLRDLGQGFGGIGQDRALRPAATPAFTPRPEPRLQNVLRNLGQGFGGIGQDRRNGPLIQIQSMTVRSEADIENISRQLHRHIQTQTRARGGR
ncbi:MAG: hypothetical protein DDT39_01393 [Firmicutes bacterium]|nr:hypothetical protein [candidate division NPL-UPA2 bacterium]